MSYRIVVYGEGEHELGSELGKELSNDRLPALPQLVHRLLESPHDITYTCRKFKDVLHIHRRGSRLAKKVLGTMLRVKKEENFTAVIIVIDRDREKDKDRIGALQRGRDLAAETINTPCAVATAVETFDAWMITDPNAIEKSGGDKTLHRPEPENLDGKPKTGNHPKDLALEIFSDEDGLRDKYATVAQNVDLDLLSKNCPKGFEPFAQEVESIIHPAISS